MAEPPSSGGARVVRAKTKAGKRALERRAPKLVEDPRRALLLHGGRTSALLKDVLVDLNTLKAPDALKYSRKNDDARPLEPGGEGALEVHARRASASLFALGAHQKKRPHSLVLGRMYDGRLYDALELGVLAHSPVRAFPAAARAQLGNKPAFVFAGALFDTMPAMRHARSMLLDFFRGRTVERLNLAGLDRLVVVTYDAAAAAAPAGAAAAAAGAAPTLLFRVYATRLLRSGGRVPRVDLAECGPRLDLEIRRSRLPASDLEKEALRRPKLDAKRVKNVGADAVAGKVGRVYVPRQDVEALPLSKPKGLKRERREAKAGGKAAKVAVAAAGGGGGQGRRGGGRRRRRRGGDANGAE